MTPGPLISLKALLMYYLTSLSWIINISALSLAKTTLFSSNHAWSVNV